MYIFLISIYEKWKSLTAAPIFLIVIDIIRITVRIFISNEHNISHALILSTHCLRCIFCTIPGIFFTVPIPSPFSPSPFHFKSAGGGRTKGYTVSRRIPFEPPLIKLKSARKRSLLINLFNRGRRAATARQSVYFRLSRLLLRSAKHREREKKGGLNGE